MRGGLSRRILHFCNAIAIYGPAVWKTRRRGGACLYIFDDLLEGASVLRAARYGQEGENPAYKAGFSAGLNRIFLQKNPMNASGALLTVSCHPENGQHLET